LSKINVCGIALCLASAAASTIAVCAQTPAQQTAFPPELIAKLESLRDRALASDYAWRQLAHLSENIGPRLSGSPQAHAAVDYVAGELSRLGLKVTLEPVMVPHWVRGEERAELVTYPGQAPGTTQKIVLTALGNSVATSATGLTAEVVVVGGFDELRALGRDKVAGRVVLFNEKFDTRMAAAGRAGAAYAKAVEYRRNGAHTAEALGAVASLVRSVGSADYRLPHTGYSAPAAIPAAAVTAEDGDLLDHLTRQGRVVIHLVLTPQTLPDEPSYNVIADMPGRERGEQVVVVSGHLDSWDLGTGAIDDAAGVVVAMETANLFKQLGLHPRRTLRVIAWMDEENRGSGSGAYIKDYQSALADHVGAIESDSGAGHPLGFDGNFSKQAGEVLEPVRKVLAPIGATLLVDTGSAEADVDPMGEAGVPAFGLMQDNREYFNYHHTAADTLDKVDPHALAENAAATAVLAYALADMPEPIPHSSSVK
jgi:carboxypeptidase Q